MSSQSVTYQGSGLVFNNTYGSGVSATFQNEIVAAENYLQSVFTNACTVNCNFDLQSINPNYSGENFFSPITVSYSTFVNALAQHATTAAAIAAANSLSNLQDPTHGAGVEVSIGEARILGLAGAGGGTDDSVILNSYYWTASALQSDPGDAEAVVEHEITEGIMGRIGSLGVADSAWAPMDFFRFTASGQRDFTGGKDGQATYFSVDGSTVHTGLQFHNSVNGSGQFDGFDFADWDQVGADASAHDPFGPGGPGAGDPGTLSATDITELNVLGWDPVNAPPQKPDLTEWISLGSTTVAQGGSVTVSAYTINYGYLASGASTAAIYLSTDATIDTSDTLLATVSAPALSIVSTPGYYNLQNISVTLPGNLTPGTYYIGGMADYNDQINKSNVTNPVDDVVAITVTGPPKPDLTEWVSLSGTTVVQGGSVTVSAYTINYGHLASGASTAAIYLSTDATIDTSDTLLATVSAPALSVVSTPGYYNLQNISVTLPGNLTPGTYYIGGMADYNNQINKSNVTNPVDDVVAITVTAPPKPDLTEWVSLSGTTVVQGGSVTVSAYTINYGQAASGASTAAIYLSTDATINTSDTLLATVSAPALSVVSTPGYYNLQNISVTLPGNLTPGTYYIGGMADYNNQINKSNVTNPVDDVVAITVTGPNSGGVGAQNAGAEDGGATASAGGTLELASAFSGIVTFAGTTGTLKLDDSPGFLGSVAGFSSQDSIDCCDITAGASATLGFSGTAAGGTLSVDDGSHIANIALLGNYMASAFVASSDGTGGTRISELPGDSSPLAEPHPVSGGSGPARAGG